ncbi:hypothetical protein [Nocardioides sediminis]|uniref:hypothetical protein n=1 Tax=Nocardioides sediminis TaxID=433648 RepID=UPI000D315663|nr:hypothetical protein [Nocardioides sediminis]
MPAHDDRADPADQAPDRPVLPPAEEAAVRARLAEARHTDPVPADVVARLDAVLADLAAERRQTSTEPVAPVVPLPSRRRRALASGLVAAAAVVVLGVALPQVLDSGGSDESTSAGDAAVQTRPDAGSDAGGGSADESAPSELAQEPGASSERSGSAFAAPLELSSDEPLRPAVRALVDRGGAAAYDAESGCAPGTGEGERVAATWDGRPAVVVLRPPAADRQVVDVYVCGSGEVVATTALPAP